MPKAVRVWVRMPHLAAAVLAAVGAVVTCLVLLQADSFQKRLARFTAPEMLPVKDQGLSLQAEAFADKSVLPAYGSSEFRNGTPFSGRRFFAHRPTGFELFVVGKAGSKSLIIAQRLGALGEKIRGKKVVIILSPIWFLQIEETEDSYRGNFSALQAETLVFDSPLSPALKADLARAMLKYPQSLADHPLLQAGLAQLTHAPGSADRPWLTELGRAEARLEGALDRVQTDFALSAQVLTHPRSFRVSGERYAKKPNWDALTRRAAATAQENWEADDDSAANLARKFRGNRHENFSTMLAETDEWEHLTLLMRTLRELGAQPFFVNLPINAKSFEQAGVTPAQMASYYARLRQTVGAFHYPLATFEAYAQDPGFFADGVGHPSDAGWMILNRRINQFYHGKLPPTLD